MANGDCPRVFPRRISLGEDAHRYCSFLALCVPVPGVGANVGISVKY